MGSGSPDGRYKRRLAVIPFPARNVRQPPDGGISAIGSNQQIRPKSLAGFAGQYQLAAVSRLQGGTSERRYETQIPLPAKPLVKPRQHDGILDNRAQALHPQRRRRKMNRPRSLRIPDPHLPIITTTNRPNPAPDPNIIQHPARRLVQRTHPRIKPQFRRPKSRLPLIRQPPLHQPDPQLNPIQQTGKRRTDDPPSGDHEIELFNSVIHGRIVTCEKQPFRFRNIPIAVRLPGFAQAERAT